MYTFLQASIIMDELNASSLRSQVAFLLKQEIASG